MGREWTKEEVRRLKLGRWKSQRRLHRKTTKAIANLGSSQSSTAESVCGPAAEGEGEMIWPCHD